MALPFFLSMKNELDLLYLKKCLELAEKAKGFTAPNPMVGSVLVKNGKIIGEGFHKGAGLPHAEVNAVNSVQGEDLKGATLYCNLEPCCHTNKRTPPCTDLIIKSGIKRVVFSNIDPNKFVSGNGIKKLTDAGIEVSHGALEVEGAKLNRFYFKNVQKNLPYITIKIASSLDGRICLENGRSKWITSSHSREYVHGMRLEHDAILVGINTFLTDTPSLNTRDESNNVLKENKKIIFGDIAKIPAEHFKKLNYEKIIFIHTGIEKLVVPFPVKTYHFVDFERSIFKVLKALYQDGICSILVEGGQKVFSSFIDAKLFDEIFIFYSPIFMGNGKSNYNNVKNTTIEECLRMNIAEIRTIGDNFFVHLTGV